YQAVCSPFRNPLARLDRTLLRACRRGTVLRRVIRRLARGVGVSDPELGWRLTQEPTFDNQLATLRFDGRQASLRIERTTPGDGTTPTLQTTLHHRLA
ncbi:MAG TPA: alkaline phosphatase family protein, partial [Solirubrobacteraceae bacterium]|nr:alkaline phosphatase family protein [Solirubrobacteraceae bacterium]